MVKMLRTSLRAVINESLILWLIVVSTVRSLQSNTEIVSCRREHTRWNYEIHDQAELDQFILEVETNSSKALEDAVCIKVSLANTDPYKMDILKLMTVNLGRNGSLIVTGGADHVKIDCVIDQYDLEELRDLLRPLTGASLVVLDGLTFVGCPVPLVINDTETVVIQNCTFL